MVVTRGSLTSRRVAGPVDYAVAVPAGRDPETLPVVVVLHGRGGSVAGLLDIDRVTDALATTGLALAMVDGGDSFWHLRADGDDRGALIWEDLLPRAAAEHGLSRATEPVGLTGFSMGGYGALLQAALVPDRVACVGAISAAVWTSFAASADGAFDDEADFDRHDILGNLFRLEGVPVRIDCGASDPFEGTNRAILDEVQAAGGIRSGCHDSAFFRSALVDQAAFLAGHLI